MAKIYEYINTNTKIRDVINHYGLLIDNNDKVLCPFHDDLHPSMSINEKKNIAKCFSCGTGGMPIKFILQYEREVNKNPITFNQAAKLAAEIGDLKIDLNILEKTDQDYKFTSNGKKYDRDQQKLLEYSTFMKDVFMNESMSEAHPEAKEYLKARGISESVANNLEIGYAVPGQIEQLVAKTKMNPILLEELGLLHEQHGEVFKNRLMIPIKDEKGNTVAFTGRSMIGEDPKYLNTHESSIFKKSELLYNYHRAKEYAYNDEMYLVEGNLDVAGGNIIGIDNIVATMGLSISEPQLNLLKKCNCDITLMRDNDTAGREAMLKEIPFLLNSIKDRSINVVDLSKLALLEKIPEGSNTKDLLDFVNAGISIKDLNDAKESAFAYYIKNKYFLDIPVNASTIYENYISAKKDGIIVDTLDEQKYIDVIVAMKAYDRKELDNILHPTVLPESNVKSLDTHIQGYLLQKISEDFKVWMEVHQDLFWGYYQEHKESVNQHLESLIEHNLSTIFNEDSSINYEFVLDYLIECEPAYADHAKIYEFKLQNIFDHAYLKDKEIHASLSFNKTQKDKILSQFESSLSSEEKIGLGVIDELYVINDLSSIREIIPDLANPILISSIEDRMSTDTKMQYFKYSTVFNKELLNYVDPIYLNEQKNDFKTILLYNNLDKSLELKQENIKDFISSPTFTSTHEPEPLSAQHEVDKKISKVSEPKSAEVHDDISNNSRIILTKEQIIKVTDTGYLFKTNDPSITLFAPKKYGYWADENKQHLYVIPKLKAFSKELTTITKYIEHKNSGTIHVDELKDITKIINIESKKNKSKISVNLKNISLEKKGEFLHVPAKINETHGYFKINQAYFDDKNCSFSGKANFEYSFYNQQDQFIEKYSISDIQKFVDAEKADRTSLIFEEDFEMEGFF